jgi:hypothetical protein
MKNIIASILKNLLLTILALIGTAIVSLWLIFEPVLLRFLLPLQESTIFAAGWSIVILSLLLLLTTAYIIYLHKESKSKLFFACGVFWDKDFNPLCPSCQKPLGNYGFRSNNSLKRPRNNPGCRCLSCNKIVYFSDEKDILMTLEHAKEKAKRIFGGNKN